MPITPKLRNLPRNTAKNWAPGTPRIISQGQEEFYARQFAKWQQLNPDAVYIANNSLWQIAKENLHPAAVGRYGA